MINSNFSGNHGRPAQKRWPTSSFSISTRLPEISGIFWLVFLATAIWRYAAHSVLPPVYDAFTYFEKAHNFWGAISKGHLFNPLNISPTFRPPGTVLMSYPFGFSLNPHGFFFRSVFFPALLLFLSVIITIYEVNGGSSKRWRVILIASFFSTLPFLYHFQLGPLSNGAYWGLVDGFLTALAALGAATVWRGSQCKSPIMAWLCIISTAFISIVCMLVKPSGFVVASIIGIIFVILSLSRMLTEWRSADPRRPLMRRILIGSSIIALSDIITLLVSLNSNYLSPENFKIGEANITVMKAELQLPLSQLWNVINSGLGFLFVVWIIVSISFVVLTHFSARDAKYSLSNILVSLSSLFIFVFGVWFWLIAAGGGTQIRYGLPFFMMGMIWLLPIISQSWQFVPTLGTAVMTVLLIAAPLNLALLLAVPKPSLAWQRFSGVALTSYFPSGSVAVFKHLVDMPRNAPVVVYSLALGSNDAVLSALAARGQMLHPTSPPLIIDRPINWINQSAIQISDLEKATYIMYEPKLINPALAKDKFVPNLGGEQDVFATWLNQLTSEAGVKRVFNSKYVVLLKISNKMLFDRKVKLLVSTHTWNESFIKRNNLEK